MQQNNIAAFVLQQMIIPDSIVSAAMGRGTNFEGRELAQKHKAELENFRQELLNQINTYEFRSKNANDQKTEVDILLRLFRD